MFRIRGATEVWRAIPSSTSCSIVVCLRRPVALSLSRSVALSPCRLCVNLCRFKRRHEGCGAPLVHPKGCRGVADLKHTFGCKAVSERGALAPPSTAPSYIFAKPNDRRSTHKLCKHALTVCLDEASHVAQRCRGLGQGSLVHMM